MAPKVFKIPDGMGGVTYQVQTPDGEWHLTDENGNFLTEDEIEGLVPSDIYFVTKDELLAKLNGGDDRD